MITIGNVRLDNGIPKICVPIVGRTAAELTQECRYLRDKIYDVVELRIDFLSDVENLDAVGDALDEVRKELPDSALLFTFRTKEEGGETNVSEDYYFELIRYAVNSGRVDAVDVEYFRSAAKIKETVELANKAGVTVVMSNHDFEKNTVFHRDIRSPYRHERTRRRRCQTGLHASVGKRRAHASFGNGKR